MNRSARNPLGLRASAVVVVLGVGLGVWAARRRPQPPRPAPASRPPVAASPSPSAPPAEAPAPSPAGPSLRWSWPEGQEVRGQLHVVEDSLLSKTVDGEQRTARLLFERTLELTLKRVDSLDAVGRPPEPEPAPGKPLAHRLEWSLFGLTGAGELDPATRPGADEVLLQARIERIAVRYEYGQVTQDFDTARPGDIQAFLRLQSVLGRSLGLLFSDTGEVRGVAGTAALGAALLATFQLPQRDRIPGTQVTVRGEYIDFDDYQPCFPWFVPELTDPQALSGVLGLLLHVLPRQPVREWSEQVPGPRLPSAFGFELAHVPRPPVTRTLQAKPTGDGDWRVSWDGRTPEGAKRTVRGWSLIHGGAVVAAAVQEDHLEFAATDTDTFQLVRLADWKLLAPGARGR